MGNKNKRNVEREINALDKVIRSLTANDKYTQPKTRWSIAKHNGMQKSQGFAIDWEGINEANSGDPLIEAVFNRLTRSDLMRKTKFNAGMYCSLTPVLFQAEDTEDFKFEAMHQIQNMIVWTDSVFGEPQSDLVDLHKKLQNKLVKRKSRNFDSILYEPFGMRRTNSLDMERIQGFTEESEKMTYSFQANNLKNLRLESETANEQDSMNSIHKIVHTMEDRGWTRKKTCSFEDSQEEHDNLRKLKEKQRKIRKQKIRNDLRRANKQFKTVFKPQKSLKFVSQLREEDADKLQSSLRKKRNIKIDLRKVDEVIVVPSKEEINQKIIAERLANLTKPKLSKKVSSKGEQLLQGENLVTDTKSEYKRSRVNTYSRLNGKSEVSKKRIDTEMLREGVDLETALKSFKKKNFRLFDVKANKASLKEYMIKVKFDE